MASSQLMIQVMGKIPLFKGFSPTQIRHLLGICQHRTLAADEMLCREGEASAEFYILVAGELVRLGEEDIELEQAVAVKAVGIVEAMIERPYMATWRTATASHVFAVPRFQFERMLRRDKAVELKAWRNLAQIQAEESTEGDEEERQLEKKQHQARFAILERQLRQQQQKLDVAIELLVQRGNLTESEAEYYIADQLKDRVPRVLIVDDEVDFRHFVKEALASFMVVEAESGAEALKIVQEERLDLIIADIRMPEMDGCTLMTNLRSKYPGVPVLAVSGYLGAEDLTGYGFDGFIDKPVELDQLQTLVEVTLQK